MIILRSVCSAYGQGKALEQIDLTAKDGEVTILLGPSGAGKSALCDVICGIAAAQSGSVAIDGYDVEKDEIEAKRHIGYVPQDPAVFRDMTIRGQMKFIGQTRELSARSLGEQVEKIIAQTKLADVANLPIRQLPEAYLQRAAVALALMGEVNNIVLDAPTKPLDAKQRLELRAVIREACAGKAVLIATDNITEAEALGDIVYVIEKGRVVGRVRADRLAELEADSGATGVLIACGAQQAQEALKGCGLQFTVGEERDGLTSVQIQTGFGPEGRKNASLAIAKAGLAIVDMRPVKRDLAQLIGALENEPFAAEGAEAQ
ncbi:MAG: ABC transporter ATP-binding protein [Eubacteriales bacterium]|nr:ABC transporter ATP-binding protein [Eubacteriales bacterium]